MGKLSDTSINKIKEISRRYPTSESALLPALYVAQREKGWLAKEIMDEVADALDLPRVRVYGVATFYTMYYKKPMGKYVIQVCTNVSCMINGGEEIFGHLKKKFGIKSGETTGDGLFSILEVECLGNCGNAPVMQVNEDFYENLTIEAVDEIIDSLKKKK
ncbi:MAG: NADH-quinone oxidoreductase subunit NuoE [Deltaproteobacteria bacterium]|uniref:NADH-quinone oxidoreductase subunit NuoE n=1 Tax=Candidatus Zymogenus saltonus TaxID=2844893 RepID=A0A9D8KD47_9DELT|nr:NADH-quinone oxidoreductase subunit NuoE [Candidatus Zymogenus saltonus]